MAEFSTFHAPNTNRPVPGSLRSVSPSESLSTHNNNTITFNLSKSKSEDSNEVSVEPNEIDHQSEISSTSTSLSYQGLSISKEDEEGDDKQKTYHERQFDLLLSEEVIDLGKLREHTWNGCPHEHRSVVWPLLFGYMPPNRSQRPTVLSRKRVEYQSSIPDFLLPSDNEENLHTSSTHHLQRDHHQILLDLPRTFPFLPLIHQEPVQSALERILLTYASRHPATGYVQGMNDLLVPIYAVILSQYVKNHEEVWSCDVYSMSEEVLKEVEADSYWCLGSLLDRIQDHYTFNQPGIQRMISRLKSLLQRIDEPLYDFILSLDVQFEVFGVKWMNCLLSRELSTSCLLRLWDTYLSQEDGFEGFHVYVCTVLLTYFSEELRGMDYTSVLTLLLELPVSEWTQETLEPVLSQAFIFTTLYEGSPSHLKNSNSKT